MSEIKLQRDGKVIYRVGSLDIWVFKPPFQHCYFPSKEEALQAAQEYYRHQATTFKRRCQGLEYALAGELQARVELAAIGSQDKAQG